MISIAQISSLARAFLPTNSPWIQKIEQAQQLASKFSASPDGVRDLMSQLGKSQEDIRQAISMLDNPMISGFINKLSPDLTSKLRNAGLQITSDTKNTLTNSTLNLTSSNSGDSLSVLRDKLNNL
jgi:hypothetical protein